MLKLLTEHPWIALIIVLWSLPWKGVALWRSARRGHVGWFFALLIVNTLAILDILYIYGFSGRKGNEEQPQQKYQPQPRSIINSSVRSTIV